MKSIKCLWKNYKFFDLDHDPEKQNFLKFSLQIGLTHEMLSAGFVRNLIQSHIIP
jgi:hypothetical protein